MSMLVKDQVQLEDYRMYQVTNFVTLLGTPAHILFIPMFFYLGYDFLAIFNVLSVAMWVYARILNSRGNQTGAITVLIVEVMAHAILATISLGEESGFQYYFLGLIPYAMFHQKFSKKGFAFLALVIALSFLVSVIVGGRYPHNDVSQSLMDLLRYANIMIVIVGVSLMSMYFREASLELEGTLKETVKDREVLIKEVHHRVKNNMQIIISLLHLQGDKYNNEISEQIIQTTESRINSMLLVHEQLFQNDALSSVNVGSYIEALSDDLKYNLEYSRDLDIAVKCEDILFSIDKLIPIGLIVNEAVTNCVKYADFKDKALIQINLEKRGDKYLLFIKDNGQTKPQSYAREGSIGVDLISGLAQSKLKGSCQIYFNKGTCIEIIF